MSDDLLAHCPISVRVPCYDAAKLAARERGISMTALVERALAGDDWSPDKTRAAMNEMEKLVRRGRPAGPSHGMTPIIVEVLRETARPMTVGEIVQHAGARITSRSRTPRTVVARDLAMDIKVNGDRATFVRHERGKYTLRELVAATPATPTTTRPIE